MGGWIDGWMETRYFTSFKLGKIPGELKFLCIIDGKRIKN